MHSGVAKAAVWLRFSLEQWKLSQCGTEQYPGTRYSGTRVPGVSKAAAGDSEGHISGFKSGGAQSKCSQ
eukprot:1687259-Rhodomonas_salina.4